MYVCMYVYICMNVRMRVRCECMQSSKYVHLRISLCMHIFLDNYLPVLCCICPPIPIYLSIELPFTYPSIDLSICLVMLHIHYQSTLICLSYIYIYIHIHMYMHITYIYIYIYNSNACTRINRASRQEQTKHVHSEYIMLSSCMSGLYASRARPSVCRAATGLDIVCDKTKAPSKDRCAWFTARSWLLLW